MNGLARAGRPLGADEVAVNALFRVAEAGAYLRISTFQVYRYVLTDGEGFVTAHTILRLLNGRLMGHWPRPRLYRLPDRLMTLGEAAVRILPRMAPEEAVRRLACFCRRVKNPPPHVRLSKRTLLFEEGALRGWLEDRSLREAVLR